MRSRGAYPEQAPPRPAGLERNAVISVWDWATQEGTRSDAQATHEWEPTFNANGRVYGVHTNDTTIAWVDPQTNTVGRIETEAEGAQQRHRRGRASVGHRQPRAGLVAVAFCSLDRATRSRSIFEWAPRQADRGVRPTH